ncbi:MAG: hypothetical protein AAGC60_27640 [Acidobacteriota bacterium]
MRRHDTAQIDLGPSPLAGRARDLLLAALLAAVLWAMAGGSL